MSSKLGLGGLVLVLVAASAGPIDAKGDARPARLVHRYGIKVDLKRYPQGSPQQTIRSVVKATRSGDIDYMLAHLISPKQVDEKFKGDIKALKVLATKATPEKSKRMVRALEGQLKDGTWTIRRKLAWSRHKGLPSLSLEKIGKHWFMHNTPLPRPTDGPKIK